MRYTMTVVEQLDRAASELAIDHPINNRLALILVDNAVELVLHHRCIDHVQRDRAFRMLPPKLTPKQHELAMGSYFDGKLKVLEHVGDLSPLERSFVRIAHDYRGELYHVGLRHDDVIRAIAGHYYLVCCALFARLKPSSRGWSSNDRFTAIGEKYMSLQSQPMNFLSMGNDVIAEKLRAELPTNIDPLPAALSASAYSAIDELERAFDFLVADNMAGMDEAEVLHTVQWNADFAKQLEKVNIDHQPIGPDYYKRVSEEKAALKATWHPRYSHVHWDRWRARCDTIEREADPLEAARLHEALRNDMAYLDAAIHETAGELDAAIQLEIDRARGK